VIVYIDPLPKYDAPRTIEGLPGTWQVIRIIRSVLVAPDRIQWQAEVARIDLDLAEVARRIEDGKAPK
jgi:hypothetical protein